MSYSLGKEESNETIYLDRSIVSVFVK